MAAMTSQRATSTKPRMVKTSQTTSMISYKIMNNSAKTQKKKLRKTYDEECADNTSQYIKCATNDDIGLDDQLQVLEEILEESNDFPKEGDDETVINVFGTTFNFDSSL